MARHVEIPNCVLCGEPMYKMVSPKKESYQPPLAGDERFKVYHTCIEKNKLALSELKVQALTSYLDFCIKLKEVPREDLVVSINGCNDIFDLCKIVDIIDNKRV